MLTDPRSLLFSGIGLLATLYIIFTGPVFTLNIPFLLVQIFGILLILWAFLARKVNKKHHTDKLPRRSFLVMKGPYEIIRHPVYAGFLLVMAGFVESYASITRFLALGILIAIVLIKIIREEHILEQHAPDYDKYKERTHKIIPYFY